MIKKIYIYLIGENFTETFFFFLIQLFNSILVQILTFNVRKYIFNSMLVQIFGKEKPPQNLYQCWWQDFTLSCGFVCYNTDINNQNHSLYIIFSSSQHKTFSCKTVNNNFSFFLYFIWKNEGKIFHWSSVFLSLYRIFFNIV